MDIHLRETETHVVYTRIFVFDQSRDKFQIVHIIYELKKYCMSRGKKNKSCHAKTFPGPSFSFTKISIALQDYITIYTLNLSRVNLGEKIHSSLGQLQTDGTLYIKYLNLKIKEIKRKVSSN